MSEKELPVDNHFFDTPFGAWLLRHRRKLTIFSQLALVIVSYVLSFLLRFEFDLTVENSWPLHTMLKTLPLILLLRAVAFYFWDLYRGWWRYFGMEDMLGIIKAVAVSTLVFIMLVMFVFYTRFPRSVFLIDAFICISFLGGVRFFLRAFREKSKLPPRSLRRHVLIYGAREMGVELLKQIRGNPRLNMQVVGFIDDFSAKKGFKIHGVPVLGGRAELGQIMLRHGIDEIIIASRALRPRDLRDLLDRFRDTGVRFRMVPAAGDILDGQVSIKQLRDVDVEDLLGRQAVHLDEELIRGAFSGRRVLITGAGGSIGSELARQTASLFPSRLILLERNENSLFFINWELNHRWPSIPVLPVVGDVGDPLLVRNLLANERPDIVLHAAAYKHVPLMESNAVAATINNVRATRVLAETAVATGVAKFVLISTDKAVRPLSVMGRTKRLAEWVVLDLARRQDKTRFLSVRFGNVLASEGSVIPLFRRQITDGGPVTVTHPEMTRYFMTIPEAVELVMQAAAMGDGGEIFVLEMGEPVRILDLARNLIRLSGFEPERDIEIKFVGLRPGEKLREELWDEAEGIADTAHEKIRRLDKPRDLPLNFQASLQRLIELAERGAEGEVRDLLDQMTAVGRPATRVEEPVDGRAPDVPR